MSRSHPHWRNALPDDDIRRSPYVRRSRLPEIQWPELMSVKDIAALSGYTVPGIYRIIETNSIQPATEISVGYFKHKLRMYRGLDFKRLFEKWRNE